MKTAREILHKHTADETAIDYLRDIIVECMEEYASQLTPSIPKIKKNVKIIYKNNKPYGIRDETGFLFFFVDITKWPNQEERYRREIEEQYELADYLQNVLSKVVVMGQISDAEIEEWAKSTLPNFGIDPSDCTVENAEIHDHYFQQYRDKIEGAKRLRDKQKG